MGAFLMLLLGFLGIFMIFIILLQRGRGGGLAGAFGGAGGQSALGTRAGDVFTKITIVVATCWVLLAGVSSCVLHKGSQKYKAGKDAQQNASVKSTDDDKENKEEPETPEAGENNTPEPDEDD